MAFENNDARPERSTIARRKLTFTTIVSETSKAIDVPVNGEILNYSITAPNLDTDTTYDLTITHEDAKTIYSNTGISDNATTVVLLSGAPVPMAGVMTFTVSFATAQVAEFDLYIYYK
jgi:hypothetical protein